METLYRLGELQVGQLIDELLTTPGNMTVVLKNMERDGFIERHKNSEDKRSSVLSLTDKGRAQIEEMLPKHAAVIEDIFSVLTADEQKSLEALLKHFKPEEKNENG